MPIYTLQLLDKKEIARDTYVFTFSKPAQLTFIPGQYGGFTLPALLKTHPTSSTRRFSLLSTPKDEHIVIATRKQSSLYKDALMALEMGSEVKFAGPSGNFVLHTDRATPAVLIAGGIGITPFYSMIKQALEENTHPPIYLFYFNRTKADAAFLNELFTLEKVNSLFKFIPSLTDENKDDNWQGETKFISDELIKKYLPNLAQVIFYICGSPSMVQAAQSILLTDLDISPDHIQIEDFPGYL